MALRESLSQGHFCSEGEPPPVRRFDRLRILSLWGDASLSQIGEIAERHIVRRFRGLYGGVVGWSRGRAG